MTDISNNGASSLIGHRALRLHAADSPALAAFIAEAADSDGAISRILQAASGARMQGHCSEEAGFASTTSCNKLLETVAELLSSRLSLPTARMLDELMPVIRSNEDESAYPWFGALGFLLDVGDQRAIDSLAGPLVRAIGLGAAFRGWLDRADPSRPSCIDGAILRAGLNYREQASGLFAAALTIAGRYASVETATELADQIIAVLPRGDLRRLQALAFILEMSGSRPALALAEREASKGCSAASLFAAQEAFRIGKIVASQELLATAERDATVYAHGGATLRYRITLRLAHDHLRFATAATRNAMAARLGPTLIAAAMNKDISATEWWPATVSLVDHAIEFADLDAYDVVESMLSGNESLARQVALHLIETDETAASGLSQKLGDPLTPTQIAERLAAQAAIHRRLGRSEAAFILYRLAAETAPLTEPLRFEAAFAALSVGRIKEAFAFAEPLSRLYPKDLATLSWPSDRIGRPWPHAPLLTAVNMRAFKPGTNWPRISVIVPSFNQVKYVRDCMQSLVLQNYPNLEIIVFDAVSTDGTIAILEEYRDRVASLIIEPDKGQSDAINKGMAYATGELLHWLNTDDMLAPGACYAVALRYLETKADIIAGACIEFSDHEMRLLNLPSAMADDFTVEELCKQFDRWLKGHFFYQPEVFFSKRIWDLTGGHLDPSHYFTMDFDLWVRAAQAGARYDRIHWPIAFFRKHSEQKTSQLEDTIDEQARTVNLTVPQIPTRLRKAEIEQRRAYGQGSNRSIAVVTKRHNKLFSSSVGNELREDLIDLGSVKLFQSPGDVDARNFSHIIQLCHVQQDYGDIESYRARGFKGAVTAWFWDNHHNYWENRRTAESADFIVAGHAFCKEYLTNSFAIAMPSVPLCITQWGRTEARALFERFGSRSRDDSLSGGFVDYSINTKRSRLIAELLDAEASNALMLIKEGSLTSYFGLSQAERFEEWCRYKTSLCLPLRRDLSQRFFDAWLAGQIVVVPEETADIFTVIPEEARAKHMVTFRKWTVSEVMEAQEKALHLFDQAGIDGVVERHKIAIEQHMFSDRIRTIIQNA